MNQPHTTATRPFRCTFANCYESFPDEKSLRKHKKGSLKHDYCHKCNLDFACWDDFVKHKAESNVHRSCKFCGADFKSVDGLKRHIQMEHPVSQNISCPGCSEGFPNAAAMISHLEHDKCKEITSSQFAGHVRHKQILNHFLNEPGLVRSFGSMQVIEEAVDEPHADGGVSVDSEHMPTDSIVDRKAEQLLGEMPPVEVSVQSKTWPALPRNERSNEGETADNASSLIGFPPLSSRTAKSVPPHMRKASNSTVSLAGSLNSALAGSVSGLPESIESSTEPLKAWGKGNTSKTLFPDAQLTPQIIDWEEAEAARLAELNGVHGTNLFSSRAWDPFNNAFDPERFYSIVTGDYECPFKKICCGRFITPSDFEKHLISSHGSTSRLHCPSCCKQFPSTTSLIAHASRPFASNRCQLTTSSRFENLIDEISGGFLAASRTARPDVTVGVKRYGREQREGIGYVKFEATTPTGGLQAGRQKRGSEAESGVKLVDREDIALRTLELKNYETLGGGVAYDKEFLVADEWE